MVLHGTLGVFILSNGGVSRIRQYQTTMEYKMLERLDLESQILPCFHLFHDQNNIFP